MTLQPGVRPNGAIIRLRREEHGLTMTQLGELVGMSRSHLNNVERGRSSLSRVKLHRIANTLSVDVNEFMPTETDGDDVPAVAS